MLVPLDGGVDPPPPERDAENTSMAADSIIRFRVRLSVIPVAPFSQRVFCPVQA